MLTNLLLEIGLNKKETEIYQALLHLGEASAREISRRALLPRTSAYPLLEGLCQKGLVVQQQYRGKVLYRPQSISCFEQMLKDEKAQHTKRQKGLEDLTNLIAPLISENSTKAPRVSVFEGKTQINKMLYEYLESWRESYERVNDYTLWGYQDHSFVTDYKEWHAHAWKTKSKQELIRLFSNKKGLELQSIEQIKQREIRLLPKNIEFESTLLVRGEFILHAVTKTKNQVAILTHDPIMASNLRAVFKLLWSLTIPPS
jgi:sugar-specific transcriptional regulator TrmB